MSSALELGVDSEQTYRVTPEMSPEHLPVTVLSTPDMIRLIEQTCADLMHARLGEDRTTVGTHVCVSHDGPAADGEEIQIWCRVSEIVKRRVTFEVSVTAAAGMISTGTHQRAIVDVARLTGRRGRFSEEDRAST